MSTLRTNTIESLDGQSLATVEDLATINKRTIYVRSVADGISGLTVIDGQDYQAIGFRAGSAVYANPQGATRLVGSTTAAKSGHGTKGWSPTVPPVSQQSGANESERIVNYINGVGETDSSGTGLFVINQETITPQMFGAFDGMVSSEVCFNKALVENRVLDIPNTGTAYNIKGGEGGVRAGVSPPSNSVLRFEPGAELKLIPTTSDIYSIINLRTRNNISLINPTLTGDADTHVFNASQVAGMGIDCEGIDGLYIKNGKINNCYADGIYLGESGPCKNVILDNVSCDLNGRQGISVISVSGLYGRNVTLTNTRTDAPGAGIDFEPNADVSLMEDIVFDNLRTEGNNGGGILFFLDKMGPGNNATTQPAHVSAVFNNYHSVNDANGVAVSRYQGAGTGAIVFNNPIIENSGTFGFNQRIWDALGPEFIISNPVVKNPNRDGLTNEVFSSAFAISRSSGEGAGITDSGNLTIKSPEVYRDSALTHAHTTDLILRDSDGDVKNIALTGKPVGGFSINNDEQYPIAYDTSSSNAAYPDHSLPLRIRLNDGTNNSVGDKFYQAAWSADSVGTGTALVFDTNIPVSDRRSRVVTISAKRSGTARMDSYIRIHNKNGAAAVDEDFAVATATNQGGTANVALSTSASNTLVLTLDVTQALDQLSVSANG